MQLRRQSACSCGRALASKTPKQCTVLPALGNRGRRIKGRGLPQLWEVFEARTRSMAQLLRRPIAALPMDSLPSAHIRQPIIAYNSSSRGPDILFWTPWVPGTHTYIQALYIHIKQEAGEMAQWLRLAVLPKDLSWIPSTHTGIFDASTFKSTCVCTDRCTYTQLNITKMNLKNTQLNLFLIRGLRPSF